MTEPHSIAEVGRVGEGIHLDESLTALILSRMPESKLLSTSTLTTSTTADDEKHNSSSFYVSSGAASTLKEDFEEYLQELASFTLERLVKEPSSLTEKSTQVKLEMEQLAFSNYKAFIQTSDCIKDVHSEISKGTERMKFLLDTLPKLGKECETFTKTAQEIEEVRMMNRLALQQHTQILELLEIPQLMDTCVRGGFYDEALELEAFAQKLSKMHGENIPLIHELSNDVKQSTQVMLRELLHKLKTNIQLPQCLRIIGFLRRLNVYSELQLRICFLKSRDVYLSTVLQSIPSTSNAYSYVSSCSCNSSSDAHFTCTTSWEN